MDNRRIRSIVEIMIMTVITVLGLYLSVKGV